MDLYEEVQRLRRVKDAIPPLPDPYTLYNKLIHKSMQLRVATRFMSDLFCRIQDLRESKKDPKERWAQLKLLETLREKTWAEFTLLRTELRTLFAVVPLIIALGMISEDDWNILMDKPQRDDRGKPLVLDQHQLEHVISDQLDILEEYRSMLAELRHEIKGEEVHQEEKFQETVLSALTEVRESLKVGFESILPGNGQNCLKELKTIVQNETSKLQELIASNIDHVRNAVTDAIGKPSPPAASEDAIDGAGDDSGGEGEGTEVLQPEPNPPDEAEVIQQNAEFMENVAVDDGEEFEAVIWQRRRQIDREIFDAYAEIEELDNLIAELKREPKCEPRDFSRGVIRRWDERTICCVFCQGIGEHYSDSCEIYKESSVRRSILKGEHRCACCLEIRFQHHICRKYNVKCYHCKRYGHHSSVCDLPGRSAEINRNLAQATHAKKEAERRIKELKEKLEELQSQVYPA